MMKQVCLALELASVIVILYLCIVLLPTGCVEVDGTINHEEQSQTTSCGKGGMDRGAVSSDMLGAFHPCCEGRAHLVPSQMIPDEFRDWLEQGPDGKTVCVPDEIITDANYSPMRCTSVFGLEGACISSCIPLVRDQQIELPRDLCPENQLCAPCVHPQTLEVTGACDIGERACTPYAPIGKCDLFPPMLDLSDFAPCCEGRGRCASKELAGGSVDGFNLEEFLEPCPDKQSLCVPQELLATGGRFQPKSCKSIGGREGRCLSVCVKAVAQEQEMLPLDSCKADERCVPCFDPRTGISTGACKLGPCDEPKEQPRAFEPCGEGEKDAFCVPTSLVPAKEACYFDNKGCRDGCSEPGTLCVPKKAVDAGAAFEPKKCQASVAGLLAFLSTVLSNPLGAISAIQEYTDGRCISKCLPAVKSDPSAKFLGSSGCDPDEVCIPCFDPTKINQGKVPTGACNRTPCPGS